MCKVAQCQKCWITGYLTGTRIPVVTGQSKPKPHQRLSYFLLKLQMSLQLPHSVSCQYTSSHPGGLGKTCLHMSWIDRRAREIHWHCVCYKDISIYVTGSLLSSAPQDRGSGKQEEGCGVTPNFSQEGQGLNISIMTVSLPSVWKLIGYSYWDNEKSNAFTQ